ncbi:MAG: hypothetical protein DRJ10_00660 [Bacteroidetes bacterium]|nr:MAG: hypothetical protein DRI89_02060 [Bacteroidota bacterium]RLD84609.1 MAG: hypothetical protein DRJ10_00660 [Bacteroidota bacterium]
MDSTLRFFENKRILITGGGGYLGSKLAEVLLVSNASLKLLDIAFNEISNSVAISNSNVELVNIDLTKKDSLHKFCQKTKPDYIFHFAAILNRVRDFEIYDILYKVNVGGTLNLLESLKNCNYKGFFMASTSEVYGVNNQVPFHEDQLPEPSSPYSLTKLMAENLCKTYSALHSKPYTILRLFNFFGPEMPEETFIGQMMAHFRSNKKFYMTKGSQKRDFVYIDNLIDQVLFIVRSNVKLFDTYNVCSNKSTSMLEVVKIFKEITNNQFEFVTSLDYRPNEIWEMIGSNKRILEMGYYPNTFSLKDDLIKTIN